VVGQAAVYDIRYAADSLTLALWDSATVLTAIPLPAVAGEQQSVTFQNLPLGIWHFAMKAADEVPNWSALSNDVHATVADLLPPAAVVNLLVSYTTARTATLSWTAPGNDGISGRATQYDIRYAMVAITEETWGAATLVPNVQAPKDPGTSESFTVTGLETGRTYYFALKTADEAPNWSPLSNVPSSQVVDLFEPDPITDLTVASGTGQSLTLTWTAPGNDHAIGRAAQYDLRYSLDLMSEDSWASATPVAGVPLPDSAGTPESFGVDGLVPGGRYYFAIKTADEAPNWSRLSNVTGGVVMNFALRRLTTSVGQGFGAGSPTWSPDGQSIAFHADWTGVRQIYRMPASGGSPIQLTSDSEDDFGPRWSPDGQSIIYDSRRNGKAELWIMDASGSNQHQLVAADMDIWETAWSPDGLQIAYAFKTDAGSEIWIIPATGGTPRQLVGPPHYNFEPAWSPDGAALTFTSNRAGNNEIWKATSDGGTLVVLTSDPSMDNSSSWSPDGTRIAFASFRTGDFEIWTMASEGSELQPLTCDPQRDYNPAWSPDGVQIAFESNRSGKGDLWVLELQ
jgi:Tol biopolymer transport system component